MEKEEKRNQDFMEESKKYQLTTHLHLNDAGLLYWDPKCLMFHFLNPSILSALIAMMDSKQTFFSLLLILMDFSVPFRTIHLIVTLAHNIKLEQNLSQVNF